MIDKIIANSALPVTEQQAPGDLGQADFLQMLIAQLENQDPLNPQEATEFTAQLATFSSLEQLVAMRGGIDSLSAMLSGSDTQSAVGMIGREILAEGNQLLLEGGPEPLLFELDTASEATTINIQNGSGRTVRSIDLGFKEQGFHEIEFDGLDNSGRPIPPGTYTMQVLASADGLPGDATSLMRGRVTGANLESGQPTLLIGDLVVPFALVREVREPGR